MGVAEAAFRVARNYANKRKQFGVAIEKLPAVAEMLVDMKIAIEAVRALTYETARVTDLENNNLRVIESDPPAEKAELKRRKGLARELKRLNSMLTPMCKYYSSEMSVTVTNEAVQVLAGSGYMRDYPVERYLRDARITTIYEGTSQLQVVAAVRGVCSGTFEKRVERFEEQEYVDKQLHELKTILGEGKELVVQGISVVKEHGTEYMDLYGRKLVDAAIAVLAGHLLLKQATDSDRKKSVARRFIKTNALVIRHNLELIKTGDRSVMDELDILAGPPPVLA